MANTKLVDCSGLASKESFASYIAGIRNATANNIQLIDQCKKEVCGALWGSGNPDISGNGVRQYCYFTELLLSVPLDDCQLHHCECPWINPGRVIVPSSKNQQISSAAPLNRYIAVATQGCDSFHDCAVFFTFSVQLASIVVLARLDFGISASDMGDSTAKITWAISLLTMLPITYVAFNPGILRYQPAKTRSRNQKSRDRKAQLRFVLFALCLLVFIYPFFSRMMETFGPSMIGGNSKIISTSEWDII